MSVRLAISVVIPAFNAERHLGATLESVFAQTRAADEVVVVDDGSTDGTARVAAAFGDRVTVLRQENAGTSAARNRGARHSMGELIAFLDSDDLWLPEKLEKQADLFAADADLELAFAGGRQFYSPEVNVPEAERERMRNAPCGGIMPSTCLVKRTTFERVGPFPEDVRISEFIDWYGRAMDKGVKTATVGEVLVERRIHTTNMGIRERGSRGDYVRVLKAALDRRRQAAAGA